MCCLETAESLLLRFSATVHSWNRSWNTDHYASFFAFCSIFIFILCPYPTAIIFSNGSLGTPRRPPRPVISSTLEGRGSLEWSMSGCHYPSPPPPEQDRRYQHKVSLVVRYFMIPCNICLILLATSTLGFAVLLFLNNCTLVQQKHTTLLSVVQSTIFSSAVLSLHMYGSLFGNRMLTINPNSRYLCRMYLERNDFALHILHSFCIKCPCWNKCPPQCSVYLSWQPYLHLK